MIIFWCIWASLIFLKLFIAHTPNYLQKILQLSAKVSNNLPKYWQLSTKILPTMCQSFQLSAKILPIVCQNQLGHFYGQMSEASDHCKEKEARQQGQWNKGGTDTAAFINTTVSVRELRPQATPRGRRLYQPQVSNQEPLGSETSALTTAPLNDWSDLRQNNARPFT